VATKRREVTLISLPSTRGGGLIVTRPPTPHTGARENHEQTIVRIDTAEGLSYILAAPQILSPPSSGHVRFPMLWAHLKVPHRGLPRASARREAAYPGRTLPNA
jgi:hypothetical protein